MHAMHRHGASSGNEILEHMKILVVGPESSGTRMMCAILAKSEGVEVVHSSPAYKEEIEAGYKYFPPDYDAAVLIVRNGIWNARSMVERNHFRGDIYGSPAQQIVSDLSDVTGMFSKYPEIPMFVVTYESMVYETRRCIFTLCEALDIPLPLDYDAVQNGNEKFWSTNGWGGDNRTLAERL